MTTVALMEKALERVKDTMAQVLDDVDVLQQEIRRAETVAGRAVLVLEAERMGCIRDRLELERRWHLAMLGPINPVEV